jgi:hypothetical protein
LSLDPPFRDTPTVHTPSLGRHPLHDVPPRAHGPVQPFALTSKYLGKTTTL